MSRRFAPALAAVLFAGAIGNASSPVSVHGPLSIREGGLVGEFSAGRVRLSGMSLGNIGSQDEAAFWGRSVVGWLSDDWGCSVIRATMDVSRTEVLDAYRKNPNLAKAKVHQVIQGAIERGIYVVLAWHEDSLSDHPADAKAFFEEMSMAYGDRPNLLFEPFDGLSGPGYDWRRLRELHEEVLSVIRPHSRNPVIVATPSKSREVDAVLASPISDSNLLYAFRIDEQSDEKTDRERVRKMVAAKTPVFVNRFSTASENESKGDIPKAARWRGFLDSLGISWSGWSVSRTQEYSAVVVSSASPDGFWSDSDLTPSGVFFRSGLLVDSANRVSRDTFRVPGRIQGRGFASVAFDHALRLGLGGRPRLELLPGAWAEYNVSSADPLRSALRLQAAGLGAGSLRICLNGQEVSRIAVSGSSGLLPGMVLISDSISFSRGTQRLRLEWNTTDTGRFVLDQMETDPAEAQVGRMIPGRMARVAVKSSTNGLEVAIAEGAAATEFQVMDPRGRVLISRTLHSGVSSLPLETRGVLAIRVKSIGETRTWTVFR